MTFVRQNIIHLISKFSTVLLAFQGGEGTLDEMCLGFLLVYPRPSLIYCLSQPLSQTFFDYVTAAAQYISIKLTLDLSNCLVAMFCSIL